MKNILKNFNVLYVEDEESIRKNISEFLRGYFKEVYLAKDGKEALELFNKHYPELIILDIQIPKIDGLSVAKKIREQCSRVKIVMLSAFSDREKLLKATELKLTKYLIKPVSPREFKNTLALVANELITDSLEYISLAEGLIYDSKNQKVIKDGRVVYLNDKKEAILKLLVKNKGSLVCYEDIMIAAWEDSFEKEISIGSVKNQISLLRKEFPNLKIESVYGKGYILK